MTRGEGEEAKGAPPKEQDRRGEKRNPGKEEPAEGGGEPPGKPPGDGDEKEKKSESATTKNLDYAPVCCSCNKQGVEQLKFREDYKSEGELTFCARISDQVLQPAWEYVSWHPARGSSPPQEENCVGMWFAPSAW